jgi:hypothetical protein
MLPSSVTLGLSQLFSSWEELGKEYKRWQEMEVVIIGSHAQGDYVLTRDFEGLRLRCHTNKTSIPLTTSMLCPCRG